MWPLVCRLKLLISPTTCTVVGNVAWIACLIRAVSCETVSTPLRVGADSAFRNRDDAAWWLLCSIGGPSVNSKKCATWKPPHRTFVWLLHSRKRAGTLAHRVNVTQVSQCCSPVACKVVSRRRCVTVGLRAAISQDGGERASEVASSVVHGEKILHDEPSDGSGNTAPH